MSDTVYMNSTLFLALIGFFILALLAGAYSFSKQSALQKQVLVLKKQSSLSYLSYLPFNNPTPIFCADRNGKIVFVSLSGEHLLSVWDLKTGDILPAFIFKQMHLAFTQNQKKISTLKIGEGIYELSIIPDKALKTAGIYIQEVTKQKQMEQMLVKTTLYDVSTNLPNRNLFNDYVKLELTYQRKGHKVFIMVVKLIDYVTLRIHHGAHFCDEVMNFTQLQLKRFLSEEGVLARLGEKEFGMMEPIYSDSVQGSLLCQKIISYFDSPIKIAGKEIFSRVAIGVAHFPEDGSTSDALLKNAKLAQQKALSEPGRFAGYHLDTQVALESKKGLLLDLYQGLQKKEFFVVYQPQINVITGESVGAEALIRWKHPELGFISPLSFVPLAESSGLIIPLGQWIVEQVCRDLSEWKARNPQKWAHRKIAINLSSVQFKTDHLISDIKNTLANANLPVENLEFELTESILSSDVESMIEKMTQLKEAGFHLSMDDFGTGYSSLSFVKNLPIHKLKIDKAFIDDIEYHQPSLAMVKSIIELGHNLGLQVLAEGVETENQFAILKTLGCDMIQGYFFSKPISSQEFERFLD